ncbi:MAG: serine/threonine-protein kinase [Acidobacteriota bacterium]
MCTIYSVENSDGVAFIAMEYVAGRPLSRLLGAGPMAAEQAARIGHQIAQGMAAAHSLGIVHGDLKPANVLVTEEGEVKISDFGLSCRDRLLLEEQETLPRGMAASGQIVGTPAYMSPEQTRGEQLTTASDVFSFGACLYEMLSGSPAFAGPSIAHVIDRIRAVQPGRYAKELPEPFTAILRRAMVPEPSDRLITMEQISRLLAEGG